MYVYMYVFLTRYIYTYGEIHLQVKWNFGSFFLDSFLYQILQNLQIEYSA